MRKGRAHSLGRSGVLAFLITLFLQGHLGRGQDSDPPSITGQPQSVTNNAGAYSKFTAVVAGTTPMAFQWFKDARPLTNGSDYSGAQTNSLTINYAQKLDEGEYWLVVTNDFGSVTSSIAMLTVRDPAILLHPQNRNTQVGVVVTFTAAAAGTSPFTYQWQFNGKSLPGATNTTSPLVYGATSNAGTYEFVAQNAFGSVTSAPAVLTVNASSLDALTADANGAVHATAIQGDGRIVVGGSFTGLGNYTRNRIGRLLPDGQVDAQFNPNANQDVYCLLPQPDGKLIVGGAFTTLGGKACNYLGRLNANGTLDTNFSVTAKGAVYCLAWQRDGSILAGGAGTLVRFDESGVADSSFSPAVPGTINSITEVEDVSMIRRIIVGGGFFSIAGSGRQNLARLNLDGTLDTTFNLPVAGPVYALARQTDGGLLLGGAFSTVGQQPRANLARLDSDGNLSPSFNPGASNTVYSIAPQVDGKILLGGNFTKLAGVDRSFLARLYPDGSIDPLFNPGANNTVYSLALQADGELVTGGNFSSLGGGTRNRLGRLNLTGDATQTLSASGGTISWLRSGGLPEVEEVVFEAFQPGNGWVSLGVGARVVGGWEASTAADPGLTLRVRGKAVAGRGSGSGSIIAFASGPAVILTEPIGASVSGTTAVVLSVEVSGTGPFQYQWYRNGVALADGKSAVYPNGFRGSYQVVVCNALGCVQSQVATIWRLNTVESAARPNPNSSVAALAMQADGKILIGGSFTSLANTPRRGLARMNADGSLDEGFDPDIAGIVSCLAVLPDARIVMGGTFTNVGGLARHGLARLNADGSPDGSFLANVSGPSHGAVYCLALEASGNILVGGSFYNVGGQTRTDLARLELNGSVDLGFVPEANPHPMREVNSILPLADGTILLGGRFAGVVYQAYKWVQQNGAHAASGYQVPIQLGLQSVVYALLQQPDGKILLGGSGFYVDAQSPRTLARLNSDHSPDLGFTAYANGPVLCLAAQADGKVLVGGAFSTLNGVARNCLGRLLPDGSVDSTFNPGVTGTNGAVVYTVAAQLDGEVDIGGGFTNVGNATRYNFARLPASATATDDWSYDGSTLTWLRDGPQAELETVTVESSADGLTWQALAEGARISGGWQITGVSMPFAQQVRARGAAVNSGVNAGQTGTLLTGPVITSQPLSSTNALGSVAGIFVSVQGPTPVGYQWYRDGVALQDGGEVTGANGPLLSFRVHEADAGEYWVTITNLFGAVTSTVAELSWVDPTTPPLILVNEPGFGFQAGRFTFNYQAVPGQTCVVEDSADLRFWSRIRTNVVNSWTPVTFTDPDPAPKTRRFYRVQLR